MIKRIIWILRSLVVTCLVARAAPGVALADGAKLVVVVAKGSAVTNISRGDLKHCFLGDQVSAGGKILVPFNAAIGSPERSGFDRSVLGMTPDEVGRFWVDRKVRGQGGAPRSLPSVAHIAKVTAKFPGAISYLPADQLTPEVQAVTVDGVAYSDATYNIVAQ
jgi:hypothetical protein